MSQTTLATVSIDLIANNASFLEGLTKAEASLKKSVKGMGTSLSGLGDAIANTLGPLGGSIGAELSSVFSGIGSAVEEMASKMSAAKGLSGAFAIGFGGLAAAGIAAAGALSTMAISGSELVDKLSNMSAMTGISIRDLQVLGAAGATANIDLDAIVQATQKFSEALTGTQRGGANLTGMLKQLGVTSRDMNEALLQVADSFSKMQDGPQKSAMAVELFGRSGLQLIPLLNQGRAGLAEFSDMVSQFGPNVDANAIQATDKWQKSTEQLSLSWDRFKVSLSSGVGLLSKVVDGFSAAIKASGDLSSALAKHTRETLSGFAHGGLLGAITSAELTNGTNGSGTSAAQQAQLAAQEKLNQRNEELFKIMQAGGKAELALANQKLDIQNAVTAGDFARALTLQRELPVLQNAADKEKARAAAAKALVAEHEKILALIEKQGSGQIKVSNVFRQTKKVAAPDLTQTGQQFDEVKDALARLTGARTIPASLLAKGQSDLDGFYDHWVTKSTETADTINRKYDEEAAKLSGDFALGLIAQRDYNNASVLLEQSRQDALGKLGTNFSASFKSMFTSLADEGDRMAAHLSEAVGGAIRDLNSQLTQFAVTGRADLSSVAKSFESGVIQSGLGKLESSALKSVGSLFHVNLGGDSKPKGTSSDPIYTRSADSVTSNPASALGHLKIGDIGKDIGHDFGKVFSGIGSSFGKIGSFFGSLFGGFRAGGGDTMPGHAYVVGERQPELFVPDRPGRIVPSVSMKAAAGGHTIINNNFAFHGVTDADSFRASRNQILNHVGNAVGRAVSRR